MALAPGVTLGGYSIVATLGEGGTKIGRDVALRVLPAAFASDRADCDKIARVANERHPPARPMTTRRFASNAEADRHDLEYWQQIPPAERVLQTWRLSVEQWQLAGHSPDEPGLCRSVARLTRR
jgi:hypothetical protein